MQLLKNNCRLGKITVFPRNWNRSTADIKAEWRISYRFYDDNLNKSKLVVIKGMNEFKILKEKQYITKGLIENEKKLLIEDGYNPITCEFYIDNDNPINERMPFIEALKFAFSKTKLSRYSDMKSALKYTEIAIKKLDINKPVIEIKRRDIKVIFDYLSEKRKWSPRTYNFYRTHLSILYNELLEYDLVESNIPRSIKKQIEFTKKREVLTPQDRIAVSEFLRKEHYRFWLFVNIFFHSGARISEFARLKLKDIDLEKGSVQMRVMKRRKPTIVNKPIKDIAIPHWQEYMKGFENKDLFFLGKNLQPGDQPIRSDQITKRWKRIVKDNKILNITADFYSLKHLNSDEVAEAIGIERAAVLNSHTSINTTKIYAINEKEREMNIIRKVDNVF